MTAHPIAPRPVRKTRRITALLAYDGPIATALLRIFQFFLVAVSFIACLVPALVFQALVGWQGTHLALWLGAASVLPLAPAVFAALVAAGVLLAPGETGAGRSYWRAFALGVRSLWWLALGLSLGVLLVGYDVALLGGSDSVLLFAVVVLALLLVLVVGISSMAAIHSPARPLIVASVRATAARPHLALSWLLLIGVGVGASMLPVIGGAIALFAPALVACGIVICNRALNFSAPDDKEHTS